MEVSGEAAAEIKGEEDSTEVNNVRFGNFGRFDVTIW
jgi:hypothetical protein